MRVPWTVQHFPLSVLCVAMGLCVVTAGKLASVAPARVVPQLAELTHAADALARWTSITSVKYAVSSITSRKELRSHIGSFMELLMDDNLSVRLAALTTLNSVIHVESVLVQHLVIPVASSPDEKVPEPPRPVVRRPAWSLLLVGRPVV